MNGADMAGEGASDKLFALIGATGLQGGATASALLATGARVRAVVRDPRSAAAEKLKQWGCGRRSVTWATWMSRRACGRLSPEQTPYPR
jgi:nucleoside-diphosphate-sugar epimerase